MTQERKEELEAKKAAHVVDASQPALTHEEVQELKEEVK